MPRQRRYPSDTSDVEWELLQPFVALDDGPGAPQTIQTRAVVDGLRYRLRTGCQWRQLPADFPKMVQVYDLLDVQAVPTVEDGNKIANVRSIISGIALTCSEYCVSFIIHEDVCLMP